jgi:nucleoside-diphosphate-sugar epimerase
MQELDPARVLVAGAGYVGSALAAMLAEEGHAVWGLRRSPQGLPSNVFPFAADLLASATLRELPPALDFVFYTAAPDHGDEDGYRTAYVEGLRNLLAALRSGGQKPRRVIFTSSTAVYAQQHGEWVDESSPTEPAGFAGRLLLEAERILLGSGLPGTVLRLGGIYGPGRSRLLDQVADATAACPPGEARWSNRIHRDDCAGALRHLMRLDETAELYLGVDREPAPLCEIMRWIARQLGTPESPVAEHKDRTTRSGRGTSNKRCSSARLADTGFLFRYPTYRDGFGAMIAERAGSSTAPSGPP